MTGGPGADPRFSFALFGGDEMVACCRAGSSSAMATRSRADAGDVSTCRASTPTSPPGNQAFPWSRPSPGRRARRCFLRRVTGHTPAARDQRQARADMEITLCATSSAPPFRLHRLRRVRVLGPGTRAHPRRLPPIPQPSWPGPNAAIDKSLSIADAIARPLMHIRIGGSSWVAGSGSRRGHKSTYVDLWPKNGPSPPRQALWGVARRVKCRRQTRLQRQSDQRHRQRHFSGNGKLGDRSDCPPRAQTQVPASGRRGLRSYALADEHH